MPYIPTVGPDAHDSYSILAPIALLGFAALGIALTQTLSPQLPITVVQAKKGVMSLFLPSSAFVALLSLECIVSHNYDPQLLTYDLVILLCHYDLSSGHISTERQLSNASRVVFTLSYLKHRIGLILRTILGSLSYMSLRPIRRPRTSTFSFTEFPSFPPK